MPRDEHFAVTGLNNPEYWKACKQYGMKKVKEWTAEHCKGTAPIWAGDIDGTEATYQMERRGHFCFFEFKTLGQQFGKPGQMPSLKQLLLRLGPCSVLFVVEHDNVDCVYLDADVTRIWIYTTHDVNPGYFNATPGRHLIHTPAMSPELLPNAIAAWTAHADGRPNEFISEMYKLSGVFPVGSRTPHPWCDYIL